MKNKIEAILDFLWICVMSVVALKVVIDEENSTSEFNELFSKIALKEILCFLIAMGGLEVNRLIQRKLLKHGKRKK